jgi:hypothetical protein
VQVVNPYISTDKTGKYDAKVTKLTKALQSIKGTDSVSCSYYPAGGGTKDSKSQKASERGKYKMMMQAYQSPTLGSAPFFEAYLAEPGVDPVDSNGVVNASQIMFPGFGVASLAQLEMRQIKDETKGDKAFKVCVAPKAASTPGPKAPSPGTLPLFSPQDAILHAKESARVACTARRPIT